MVTRRFSIFIDIELRIGDNNESGLGITQFRFNPLAGFYAGNNTDHVASFGPLSNVMGRYLTFQRISLGFPEIAEIHVYNMT